MGKPLSDRAREKVAGLIRDHHLAFRVEVLGHDSVPRETYQRLVGNGILHHDAGVAHSQVSIQAAHTVGKMAARTHASDLSLARMPPEKFWKFIAMAPPQFTAHELDAINATKAHVGRLISNLAVSLSNDFDQATNEEAVKLRHEALAVVQHEIALGIARRQSHEQIERRFRRKLKDVSRDWALVVATELHNASEHGKAMSIAASSGDPLVYKLTRQDACRFCVMLYKNGNRPRLFKLSELVNNGTNYSRKAVHPTRAGKTGWLPVIGSTHPGCQCELHELPAGHTFDKNGNLVASMRKSTADDLTAGLRALIGHQCEA